MQKGLEPQVSGGVLSSRVETMRLDMETRLLRMMFGLVALSSIGIALRELIVGGPALAALLGVALGLFAWWSSFGSQRFHHIVGILFCHTGAALILLGAWNFGGATGSALALAFLPGFLAILTLGPVAGWSVCGLTLLGFVGLYVSTELPTKLDLLRFVDEGILTLYSAGLAHSLRRSLVSYEKVIADRGRVLLAQRDKRALMTRAIYDKLEPLSARLNQLLSDHSSRSATSDVTISKVLEELITTLSGARTLAQTEPEETATKDNYDAIIRTGVVRLWLRWGILTMAFLLFRNIIIGSPWWQVVATMLLCLLVDLWLRDPRSSRYLEFTALGIGWTTLTLLVSIVLAYGGGIDAPPLVILPATVLFSTLLSQGPASWITLLSNLAVLFWVSWREPLSLLQYRLLGNLALSLLILVFASQSVFSLRRRYVQTLLNQSRGLKEELRKRRRLAGTLFHDVNNHLQSLTFWLEAPPNQRNGTSETKYAETIGHRIHGLIESSKAVLLDTPEVNRIELESMSAQEALDALLEVFRPRLESKRLRMDIQGDLSLRLLASRNLLVESVLGNLVSNAIKFSPRGSNLTFAAERQNGEVKMAVMDSGPGVPGEVLAHLNDEGAVASTPGTEGEKGSGFGLQLVGEHLSRMGGRLELKPRAAGGTEAAVWLPSAST